MNFDKIKKAFSSHDHIRDKSDKKTPYKCLECQKYYYDSHLGFGNNVFLIVMGIVLGEIMILDQLRIEITEQNAFQIINLLLPFLSIGFMIFGIDLISNIKNIIKTDKTRLTTKSIKVDYYTDMILVGMGCMTVIACIMMFYVVFTLNQLKDMVT